MAGIHRVFLVFCTGRATEDCRSEAAAGLPRRQVINPWRGTPGTGAGGGATTEGGYGRVLGWERGHADQAANCKQAIPPHFPESAALPWVAQLAARDVWQEKVYFFPMFCAPSECAIGARQLGTLTFPADTLLPSDETSCHAPTRCVAAVGTAVGLKPRFCTQHDLVLRMWANPYVAVTGNGATAGV